MRCCLLGLLVAAVLVSSVGARQLPPLHPFHANNLDQRAGDANILAQLFSHMQASAADRVAAAPINMTAQCPSHPYPVGPLRDPLPSDLQAALDRVGTFFSESLEQQGITGMSASVSHMGKQLRAYNFGTTSRDSSGKTPTGDSIFRVGSITKVFAVVSLFQAVELGLIESLEEPIANTVPEFYVDNRFSDAPLTWRALACQLSGLPREAPCDFACDATTEEILERLHNTSTILPPWTRPSYSNLAYSIIGRMLEPVLGMEWERWVEEKIFKPLGMNDSYTRYNAKVEATLAKAYLPDGSQQDPVFTDLAWSNPAGSIFSTVNDMDKFLNAFVTTTQNKDSPILTATSMREMMLPTFINPDGWSVWSYPWESFFIDSYLVRCKGGNVDQYSGATCVLPELGLTLNALWSAGMDEFGQAVVALEQLIPPMRSAVAMFPPQLPLPPNVNDYVGGFAMKPGGLPVIIIAYSAAENALLLKQPGMVFFLAFVQDGLFSLIPPPGAQPCLAYEFLAYPGEMVSFSRDLSTFTLPGYGYGATFYRVK